MFSGIYLTITIFTTHNVDILRVSGACLGIGFVLTCAVDYVKTLVDEKGLK